LDQHALPPARCGKGSFLQRALSKEIPMRKSNTRFSFVVSLILAATALLGLQAAQAAPKLHPVKSYTIVYTLEGMQAGTVTQHSRDYGNLTAEISQVETRVAGKVFPDHKQVIADGEWLTTVDLTNKTATRVPRPKLEDLSPKLKGRDPLEVAREMFQAMGAKPTGKKLQYAAESCEVWTQTQGFAITFCITSDGLSLYSQTSVGGMTATRTATTLKRGDGGPDSAYKVPAGISVSEGINPMDALKNLKNLRKPPKSP
jgi:hypothetical protein